MADKEELRERLAKARKSPKETPSVEQVEEVFSLWDSKTIKKIAKEVDLKETTIQKIGAYARKAVKANGDVPVPSPFCSGRSIKSRVECVLAKNGYVIP